MNDYMNGEIKKLILKTKNPQNQRLRGSLVLGTGLEPVRTNVHWILSPTCLPIPPPEHGIL